MVFYRLIRRYKTRGGILSYLCWLDLFFNEYTPQINKIFRAGGCRELWLQGQIYLHSGLPELKTNYGRKNNKATHHLLIS